MGFLLSSLQVLDNVNSWPPFAAHIEFELYEDDSGGITLLYGSTENYISYMQFPLPCFLFTLLFVSNDLSRLLRSSKLPQSTPRIARLWKHSMFLYPTSIYIIPNDDLSNLA